MAKRKKRKLKIRNFLKLLVFICLLVILVMYIYSLKITSISVKGNTLYTDWEIIKLAGLEDYPSSMQNMSIAIESKLEDNPYITSATVKKSWITNVEIKVEENVPLFYYVPNQTTILADGTEVEENFSVPTLINYVPNKIYSDFLEVMNEIDYSILKRISEIKYDPNDVDEERFLLTMNDGNYVYITIDKFDSLDHYLEIIKEFNNKKGILYLDSGEYFEVIE